MQREQIALELTKLYIEQQHTIPSELSILKVYLNFLTDLESKGE